MKGLICKQATLSYYVAKYRNSTCKEFRENDIKIAENLYQSLKKCTSKWI